jgi:CheY-like chemotaxis protein
MNNSILLVDDDNIFNFLNRKVLVGMGVTDDIHVALNGNEALKLLNDYFSGTQSFPRVIFLDLNMPIMDGFGFIEAFQRLNSAQNESTLIVIVTSSQNPDDLKRAKELGINHYITKPISENAIRSVLEAAGVVI